MQGVGGQMWRIQFPDGTMATLSSNNADMVPAGYGFISPSMGVFTGLRVNDTNSTLNGTTFQCIAFIPATVGQQNDSAAAVTLEVGGECRINTWCKISKDKVVYYKYGKKVSFIDKHDELKTQ